MTAYTSKMTVLWEARDKNGLHYYVRKPELVAGANLFTGVLAPPCDLSKCVIRRNYRVNVVGRGHLTFNYHGTVQVPLKEYQT